MKPFLIILLVLLLFVVVRNPGIAKTPVSCEVNPVVDCVCFVGQKETVVTYFDTATEDYCETKYECVEEIK